MDSRFELIPFMLSVFGDRVACVVAGEITSEAEFNKEANRRNSLEYFTHHLAKFMEIRDANFRLQ